MGGGCAEGEITHSLICCEQAAPKCSSCFSSYWNDFLQLPCAWFVVRLLVILAWLLQMEHGCLAAVYVGSLSFQWLHFFARRAALDRRVIVQGCLSAMLAK